ncbi:MAG: hypothetical protein Q7S51_07390 [Gallionellaceae bacterium]|nr:hypothetical protein [Gallionellaceae bacterium]
MKPFIKYAALAAVFLAFFGHYFVPIWDMDFWWHIASGRYFFETHTIPAEDPFSVYDADDGPMRASTLRFYWLAQIGMFLTYNYLGTTGIIFLKAATLTLCLALTFFRSKLIGASGLSSLAVMFIVGMGLLYFTGDRPQLLSFLFFPIVALLLEFSREKKVQWPLYLLPPIMLLWANMHGGITLGGVVLMLMALSYAIEWRWFEGQRFGGKWFFAIIVFAVLCTLLTPSGLNTYWYLAAYQLGDGVLNRERTSEYASPITLWQDMNIMVPFYWGFLLLAVIALPKAFKKSHLTPLWVSLLLAAISLNAFRYIPFFILYAAPYVALGLSRLTAPIKFPTLPAYGAILAIALFTLGYGVQHGQAFQGGLNPARYPIGAVEFIQKNKLSGKIFNGYTWGGYLIWHLNPQINVYIDGRALYPRRFNDYTHILWATPYGVEKLDQDNFDFVLIPYATAWQKEPYKLNAYLLQNPQWQVVYQDQLGYMFARKKTAGSYMGQSNYR